jgi:hypothetical protein
MTIVITDAQVGEVIDIADVAVAVELHPCDGRRMSSSRHLKEEEKPNRRTRIGTSPLNLNEWDKVFAEAGLSPLDSPVGVGLISARNIAVPTPDSEEMTQLNKAAQDSGGRGSGAGRERLAGAAVRVRVWPARRPRARLSAAGHMTTLRE